MTTRKSGKFLRETEKTLPKAREFTRLDDWKCEIRTQRKILQASTSIVIEIDGLMQGIEPQDERVAYLRTILRDAVDPDALKASMQEIGIEKSIFNLEADRMARYFAFRVAIIDDQAYILCPVPFLYDEDRGIEAGFAVDVDQDHFSVYAYLYNHFTNESIVLSRLPHCVYHAIALDATAYDVISDEIKEISNEASAIFFINSLIADLTVENIAPIEFFDDQLYLQLLNKFTTIKDEKWINFSVMEKKFDQIMRQLEALDADDPFYSNNKRRIFTNLVNLVWGMTNTTLSDDFVKHVGEAAIQRHAATIQSYIATLEFWDALQENDHFYFNGLVKLFIDLLDKAGLANIDTFLEDLFKQCLTRYRTSKEYLDVMMELIPYLSKQSRWKNTQRLYKSLMIHHDLASIRKFHESSKTIPAKSLMRDFITRHLQGKPRSNITDKDLVAFIMEYDFHPEETVVEAMHGQLLRAGNFDTAKTLAGFTNIQPSSALFATIIQEYFEKRVQFPGRIHELIEVLEWSGLELDPDQVDLVYQEVLGAGNFNDAIAFSSATQTHPRPELLQQPSIMTSIEDCWMDTLHWRPDIMPISQVIESWGFRPSPGFTDAIFFSLLDAGKINGAVAFSYLTNTCPRAEILKDPLIMSNLEHFLKFAKTTKPSIDAVIQVMEWMQLQPNATDLDCIYRELSRARHFHAAETLLMLAKLVPVARSFKQFCIASFLIGS